MPDENNSFSDSIVNPDQLSGRDPRRSSVDAEQRNRDAWDRMAQQQHPFARPVKEQALKDPLSKVDPRGWLGGDVSGKELLCLAAGGGKHSVIYASAGAHVTVVDLSPAMLAQDRKVGAELGLSVNTVEASMNDLSMLDTGRFEVVIHPVSTCYLPDTASVYKEVARVTKTGGIYISQHKQPASLQSRLDINRNGFYELSQPIDRQGPLPQTTERSSLREPGTSEFVHSWEALIGAMCQAGFLIEDLVEPWHGKPEAQPGEFGHRARYLPPYVRVKARRRAEQVKANESGIWLPEQT